MVQYPIKFGSGGVMMWGCMTPSGRGMMYRIEEKWISSCIDVKGNVVRTNIYHKYIKDLKLNITIDLDGFIY